MPMLSRRRRRRSTSGTVRRRRPRDRLELDDLADVTPSTHLCEGVFDVVDADAPIDKALDRKPPLDRPSPVARKVDRWLGSAVVGADDPPRAVDEGEDLERGAFADGRHTDE